MEIMWQIGMIAALIYLIDGAISVRMISRILSASIDAFDRQRCKRLLERDIYLATKLDKKMQSDKINFICLQKARTLLSWILPYLNMK